MILEKTLPLLVIFLIGYLLRKRDVLAAKDATIFGKLLSNLVIPAIIIGAFAEIKLDLSLIYLPISALFIVITLITVGYVIGQRLSLPRETRGAFITAFPTLEGGAVGYVFMLTTFGELGLNRIVLFDIANIVILFTIVYGLSRSFGSKKEAKIGKVAFNIIKTPLIWAVVIGILLNTFEYENVFLSHSLELIGGAAPLLMMLLLGLKVQFDLSDVRLSSLTVLLKTSIGLLLGWLAAAMFGFSGVERVAVIVAAALPPSMITLVFAEENQLDTRYVANLISIAMPFSLLFFPILISFLT